MLLCGHPVVLLQYSRLRRAAQHCVKLASYTVAVITTMTAAAVDVE